MPVALSHLDNGIDLILEPIVTAKTAAIGFWFSVGSRYEPKNQRGITHFVEHMLFKGTSSRTARDIALAFDRIGGYINAFTDRENLCVHCVVPSEYAEKAIEIMNDMMNHSLFSPEEIEKERQVIESREWR
jgi:predicted Zn-dependent peptidase